uniref:PWI domain-containing protein n=1 Tax=Pseudo-nitzschia australis TaxID=44445 RepID=A0A7S4ANE1_9STRA
MPSVKGTASVSDSRARTKALRTTRFPRNYRKSVDLEKVNKAVLTQWIEQKITSILGFDDEIVSSTAINLFVSPSPSNANANPDSLPTPSHPSNSNSNSYSCDPKQAQLDLAGECGCVVDCVVDCVVLYDVDIDIDIDIDMILIVLLIWATTKCCAVPFLYPLCDTPTVPSVLQCNTRRLSYAYAYAYALRIYVLFCFVFVTGFLGDKTATFCSELWSLMLEAQASASGIPQTLLEQKKKEMAEKLLATSSSSGGAGASNPGQPQQQQQQ